MIRVRLRSTDNILNACTEHFVFDRFVEECLNAKITVSGIECVTGHHVQLRILIFPACHFDFCNDTHRTVRDNTLRAGIYRSYMSCFFSVPSFESPRTTTVEYPEDIVTESSCQLFISRVELRFFDLQSFIELTVDIWSLLFVKVKTITYQFRFQYRTMRANHTVYVAGAGHSNRLHRLMLSFSRVGNKHFGINPGRISLRTLFGRQCDLKGFSTVSREAGDECKFVHLAVSVQVVQLRRDFSTSFHDYGGLYFKSGMQIM